MGNLQLNLNQNKIEAGVDEAGRGSLIGPVFAAAVILPKDFENSLLNDSKKLSEKHRNLLRKIIEKEAIAWQVASIDSNEIDKVNILNATYMAMHKAISGLEIMPELLLIDGNRFKAYKDIQHKCIVKGDSKFLSIAAASILAKTHRDEFILKLHNEFPHFCWDKNKGYGTAKHQELYRQYGPTKYHRKTFSFKPKQLKLEL